MILIASLLLVAEARVGHAATLLVPGGFATIQSALNTAAPGDTIEVATGVYNERIAFPSSGTAGNPIVLTAGPGQSPVIDGTGLSVSGLTGLVEMIDRSYVQIVGFEIRNYAASSGNDFPAGIWLRGQSESVEIRANEVHAIENNGCGDCGAHGIGVYGTTASGSINNVLIEGNTVRDCVLGWSEALVLNGNVENFIVSNNTVHDNNNIGIDMIGFEGECVGCPDDLDQARDGVVADNLVYNIDSFGNPAYGTDRSADGIYVDGGTRIVIERNIVHHANIGIEIASEHAGKATSEITVRNNFVYASNTTGFAMGGYDTNRGSTEDCVVAHNTFYENDTDSTGSGEMLIQFDTLNNIVSNNIFHATSENVFITNAFTQNSGDVIDYNIYYGAPGAATSAWIWQDNYMEGFASWQAASMQDANSQFIDPQLVDPASGDLHLSATSPAFDAGTALSSLSTGALDIDGENRLQGAALDVGADEITVPEPAGLMIGLGALALLAGRRRS
ncbi:MAG: right-handed parallel beta-helix repeat-containing protein [Myxococcota bacterium]